MSPPSAAGSAHSKTSDTNPDCVLSFINCTDLQLDGSGRIVTGFGFGPKSGTSDLKELNRRSGLSLPKLQEALGILKEYYINNFLLQRSTLMRPTDTYEYLIVVPEGDWRTAEFAGDAWSAGDLLAVTLEVRVLSTSVAIQRHRGDNSRNP